MHVGLCFLNPRRIVSSGNTQLYVIAQQEITNSVTYRTRKVTSILQLEASWLQDTAGGTVVNWRAHVPPKWINCLSAAGISHGVRWAQSYQRKM